MRDVLLTFESESLFIASTAAKRDNNGARPRLNTGSKGRGHERGHGRSRSGADGKAQKFPARLTAQVRGERVRRRRHREDILGRADQKGVWLRLYTSGPACHKCRS